MTRISLEQFMFGNRHWRSYRAVDEIEVYCDLLENLQDRIDSLEAERWVKIILVAVPRGACDDENLSRTTGSS